MIRIAINGYGRIGRCLLRSIFSDRAKDFELVGINDLADPALLVHLTKYDTTQGVFKGEIALDGKNIVVDGNPVRIIQEEDPDKLPWSKLDVDIVLECSGLVKSKEQAMAHLHTGAKKILVSQPMDDPEITVVYGVNHQNLKATHRVVSNGSCTTNCLAPVAMLLDDTFGIEQGNMTTIHSYTNDQTLLDKASGDFYRARAAAYSMIPTETGVTKAVGQVLPRLSGKLEGMAVRVPTLDVSLVDLHVVLKEQTSVDAVHQLMREAAEGKLKNILAYNEEPLVSIDFIHNPHSSIFDANHTALVNKQLKVMCWYDNEWAFAQRMLDTASQMQSASLTA